MHYKGDPPTLSSVLSAQSLTSVFPELKQQSNAASLIVPIVPFFPFDRIINSSYIITYEIQLSHDLRIVL